jgi:hypothetical protein
VVVSVNSNLCDAQWRILDQLHGENYACQGLSNAAVDVHPVPHGQDQTIPEGSILVGSYVTASKPLTEGLCCNVGKCYAVQSDRKPVLEQQTLVKHEDKSFHCFLIIIPTTCDFLVNRTNPILRCINLIHHRTIRQYTFFRGDNGNEMGKTYNSVNPQQKWRPVFKIFFFLVAFIHSGFMITYC